MTVARATPPHFHPPAPPGARRHSVDTMSSSLSHREYSTGTGAESFICRIGATTLAHAAPRAERECDCCAMLVVGRGAYAARDVHPVGQVGGAQGAKSAAFGLIATDLARLGRVPAELAQVGRRGQPPPTLTHPDGSRGARRAQSVRYASKSKSQLPSAACRMLGPSTHGLEIACGKKAPRA